jgi:hypothetical protein
MASSANARYHWGKDEERFYIDFMLSGIATGRRPNGSFKADFWTACLEAFEASDFRTPTLLQLNNKRSEWRSRWSIWSQLKEQSGWGINRDTGVLEASASAWERAIRIWGKDARWFQSNVMPYQEELTDIFGTVSATGALAQGSDGSVVDPMLLESPGTPQPADSISQALSSSSTSSNKRKAPSGDQELADILRSFLSNKSQRIEPAAVVEPIDYHLQAIQILQADFQHLGERDFLRAVKIVKNDAKTFVALTERWRVPWLLDELENSG